MRPRNKNRCGHRDNGEEGRDKDTCDAELADACTVAGQEPARQRVRHVHGIHFSVTA